MVLTPRTLSAAWLELTLFFFLDPRGGLVSSTMCDIGFTPFLFGTKTS